ncbi:gastrula zinc finger protein XlCGF51.1A-like [Mytilus edulis]|uniref:gastrula zinc finger protein XlCGF51.1A-like n=1 Tax=Mytilus edulis TaxID=6550 RepID=UPI0039F0B153
MHICDICGKNFKRKWNLTRHNKTHESAYNQPNHVYKLYKCEKNNCGAEFTTNTGLWQHKRREHLHKVERGLNMCPLCDKIFGQKIHLHAHMTCHSEERKFICDRCCKPMKHQRSLKRHYVRCKGIQENKQFACSVCKKEFQSKQYLKVNCKSAHQKPVFQCDSCGEIFKWQSSYNRHTAKGRCHGKKTDNTFSFLKIKRIVL